MRWAWVISVSLFFSPARMGAASTDRIDGPNAGRSSGVFADAQMPLLVTPMAPPESALTCPILPPHGATDGNKNAGAAADWPSATDAPELPIISATAADQGPAEAPALMPIQDIPGIAMPPEIPFPMANLDLPGFYSDTEEGFTASMNGFNYPFVLGIPLGLSVISGTRVLPSNFQPQLAARFPSVGEAGSIFAGGVLLGLGYSPRGLGTFSLNYRVLSGSTTAYYVTANGQPDPLVAPYVPSNNADYNNGYNNGYYGYDGGYGGGYGPGYSGVQTIVVSDAIGSCIVNSHFTLNQIDLTYTSPTLPLTNLFGLFAEIGSRGAVFFREDYTNSSTVFQQAKSTDAGVGPVCGLGLSFFLGKGQVYVKADGGSLFSWAHQLDREMVVGNNSTQIQANEINGFHSVPMLGIEVGALLYEGPYLTFGVKYRFDQWWGLDNLGGSEISWDSNGVEFDLRWRY
ncbi:MAG TPA: hypothetical protein VKS79_19815 [Gemmataceae bacterium]|nr:hypothetical protein [Gemmataceae bacterium]